MEVFSVKKSKKGILICIILIVLAVCFLPFPRRYNTTFYGTNLQYGYDVPISIKGWEYCYLLRDNKFDFRVEIRQNGDIESIIWKTPYNEETHTPPDETMGRYCQLVRYDSEKNEVVNASFGFTKALDCCVIKINGAIQYVASANANATVEGILENFPIMTR